MKSYLLVFILLIIIMVSSCSKPNKEDEREQRINQLKSLAYMDWTPIREGDKIREGVTVNENRSFPGLNLYSSIDEGIAYLIDLNGNIIHKWSIDVGNWSHVELGQKGNLFGVTKGKGLIKIDWNSNIIWQNSLGFHHDLDIADNGDIYAITTEKIVVPYKNLKLTIANNYIAILSPNGSLKRTISLFDMIGGRISNSTYERIADFWSKNKKVEVSRNLRGTPANVFHVNTVEIIRQDFEGLAEKGDLLLSIRNMDLLLIMDPKGEKVKWTGGQAYLKRPHHPTLLDNGNILVFDNEGNNGFSRVLELNPLTEEIVWSYKGNDTNYFYSVSRGSSQRLPNGNTLVTESDRGHVFEITKDGEIVWEFWNPRMDKDKNERATIYRMVRVYSEQLESLPLNGNN